ncbi:MAG: hypothetical protein IT363_11755 [Methanoregulaceae archaeon]|nr:hypothetical protein [Methanoregulaceae archaeon]
MSRRRGVTLIELMATLIAVVMAVAGAFAVMLGGLKSFQRTQAEVAVAQPNSQAIRRVVDTLRGAMSVTISNSGRTISYTLPARSATVDPVTGEQELVFPLTSDGVTRSFTVTNGQLVSQPGNRVLLRDVSAIDPLPDSSQFNQAYAPFQSTTIGSRRAITVTFIAAQPVAGETKFARMKSTVLIQNSR